LRGISFRVTSANDGSLNELTIVPSSLAIDNPTDDPYFSDGNRMAIGVSSVPVQPWQVANRGWNESTDPIREGKGEDARVQQAG